MAEENENVQTEPMFQSWDGKPIYAKKAELDKNGNSLELTIEGDTVTAIGGKSIGVEYTTKDVYDADVYGGIVIETRDGGTRVAILNEHAEYVPAVTATVQSVEFNRSFVPNVMSTVWFPFSFKASELANAHIYKLNNLTYDVESGKYIMGNDDITELTGNDVVAACTPYMISVSASKLEFDFDGDVEINTNEFYPYFVTFNSATHGFIPGGTFTPVDTRISKFGDLPGWGSNQYYGFAGSSSGSSIKNGDFVKVSDTVWVWLFRAYFVHPND